jgi:hypothetical protein
MKYLLFLLLICLMASCGMKCEDFCGSARFVFTNEKSQDIFDSTLVNHIDSSEFKMYVKDTLNWIQFEGTSSGKTVLRIGLPEGYCYLKFGNITTDTIFTKFREKRCGFFISHIYYNGKELDHFDNMSECGGLNIYEIQVKKE